MVTIPPRVESGGEERLGLGFLRTKAFHLNRSGPDEFSHQNIFQTTRVASQVCYAVKIKPHEEAINLG